MKAQRFLVHSEVKEGKMRCGKEGNSPSFFTSEGCEELWGTEEVLSKRCFESMYIVDMDTAMSRYITSESLGNGRAPTSLGEGRGMSKPSSGLCENRDIVYRKYPIQIFSSQIFLT